MTLSDQILSYLVQAATSNFVEQDIDLLDHWEGQDNLLWRVQCNGQEAVLKLFLDAGQARSRRQFDGQQMFANLGIAPRPLWFDRYPEGLARQVLVYEWSPGTALDMANSQQRHALAQTLAQVHSHDVSDVRRVSPNPINLDYLWQLLSNSITTISAWLGDQQADAIGHFFHQLASHAQIVVETALPLWLGVPPAPIHGDPKIENCIDQWGAVVLLDWEMFGMGDPALEIANFLYVHQQAMDRDMQNQWLADYLAHCEQSGSLVQGLEERIVVYERVLPFQAVCYLLDGLQTLPAQEMEEAEFAEVTQFLSATLAAAFDQAAAHLNVNERVPSTDEISAYIEKIF